MGCGLRFLLETIPPPCVGRNQTLQDQQGWGWEVGESGEGAPRARCPRPSLRFPVRGSVSPTSSTGFPVNLPHCSPPQPPPVVIHPPFQGLP